MATDTTAEGGLVVVAHGEDELHLVREGYFATWAHVHLGRTRGQGRGDELHLECEHPLADVLAATPKAEQMTPVMAQAFLVARLAREAQRDLFDRAVDETGRLRDLPRGELSALLDPVREAADTLSTLSAELARVLIDPSSHLGEAPCADQATKAVLAAIVVHDDLANLVDLIAHHPVTSPRPGRNQPCPCGSGRKYKHCCGATS